MQPHVILADATPGALYAVTYFYKNNYPYTAFWVSFDYGKNWILREENMGERGYYTTNVESVIYRGNYGEVSKSMDYGLVYFILEGISRIGTESGFNEEDFFEISGSPPYDPYILFYTDNLFQTYTENLIDPEYVFGEIWGRFPDVYRGGLPGEVYVSSMFPYGNQYNPDVKYKVSFSADTGHTFRHVYESEFLDPNGPFPIFMSDREPGVFYIIRAYEIKDTNPAGWHSKICIQYYRDYGETLVATYCHDLTKDYKETNAIDENRVVDFRVYPNPTSGE